jgi:exonuclease III
MAASAHDLVTSQRANTIPDTHNAQPASILKKNHHFKRHKKVRRSTWKKQIKMTIFYSNMNGFQSKKESLRLAVEKLNPEIISLCETKLPAGTAVKDTFPEYEVCTKPTKVGKSGLALCVKKGRFQTVMDVTSSPLDDILVVRICMGNSSIRVVLGYAPQETANPDVRETFFSELQVEITKSKMAGEEVIIIGDMNAKIENIEGEIKHISDNGRLLQEAVENQDLQVLNFHQRCQGKWTHVIRTTGASSVLDYIMTTSELAHSLHDITIDEDCIFCPFWLKKKRGSPLPQYSDHNSIIGRFNVKIGKTNKTNLPPPNWKLTHAGMEKFHNITSTDLNVDIPNGDTPQGQYNTFEAFLNSIMNQCFRKSKPKKDNELAGALLDKYKQINIFARGGRAQRRIAKLYIEELINMNSVEVGRRNKEKIYQTMQKLTIDDKFSPDNFWKLCRSTRKPNINNTSVETDDGVELYGEDVIRHAYRNEFLHRLRKRDITPELQNFEIRTEQICLLRLEESKENVEKPYEMDELLSVKKKIKAGKSSGRDLFPPEIFIRCGDQLDTLLLSILNIMKSAELAPEQWLQVQITTIYKNKGKRKCLVNYRGIFLKQILSKIFERLNMNRIEPQMKAINKFQAGSRSGRSPPDQQFLLRAAIDHSCYLNKAMYTTLYDYSQCFDSIWLSDSLLCLWRLGVNSETLNNIKKLNQTCNFVVKTPMGLSPEASVTSIVQQGSVTGGALCSASTAEIVREDLGNGCQIGSMNIKALTFVDDIATTNSAVSDTYKSNGSIEWFSKKKRLELNVPKCFIVCVNQKCTDILPRLKIAGNLITTAKKGIYLGDPFNSQGNNHDLIEDRVKKGNACIVNTIAMCDEVTMGLFAIQTLLLLHGSLLIPVMLFNSSAWTKLTTADLKALQTTQLKHLKRTFHAPQSTPNSLTFLETGVLPVEMEIHRRQLNFLHHILTLDNDDPVKLTYLQQLKYPYEENWGNEIKIIRKRYNLPQSDEEIENISKNSWKHTIKKHVHESALLYLNNEKNKLKTCTLPDYTKLGVQDYLQQLHPQQARAIFQIRTNVVDIKAVRKYQYTDALCRLCNQADENIDHIINSCPEVQRPQTAAIDIHTIDTIQLRELARRYLDFTSKVEDLKLV